MSKLIFRAGAKAVAIATAVVRQRRTEVDKRDSTLLSTFIHAQYAFYHENNVSATLLTHIIRIIFASVKIDSFLFVCIEALFRCRPCLASVRLRPPPLRAEKILRNNFCQP